MDTKLKRAKNTNHQNLQIHSFEKGSTPVLATWVDAAHAKRPDGASTKGVLVGWPSGGLLAGALDKVTPLFWQRARILRVCRSSAAEETCAAVDGEDELYALRFQAYELLGGIVSVWKCDDAVSSVKGVLISDSKNVFDRLNQTVPTFWGAEKRSDIESFCLQEGMCSTATLIKWVNGDSQLANSLTKEHEHHQISEYLRRNCRWRIVYDPTLLSGRKRKLLGLSTQDGNPRVQEAPCARLRCARARMRLRCADACALDRPALTAVPLIQRCSIHVPQPFFLVLPIGPRPIAISEPPHMDGSTPGDNSELDDKPKSMPPTLHRGCGTSIQDNSSNLCPPSFSPLGR